MLLYITGLSTESTNEFCDDSPNSSNPSLESEVTTTEIPAAVIANELHGMYSHIANTLSL